MSLSDYDRIAEAIKYIEENSSLQPSLDDIASHVGLSPFHFQKLFSRWAGISPKRFLQFVTLTNAKKILKQASILDTTYEVGLSSPSRLHDLFISAEGISPGEYKNKGSELSISYGTAPSPFGECFIAETDRGICHLAFEPLDIALEKMKMRWLGAEIARNDEKIYNTAERIFDGSSELKLHMKGTNFQIKVWSALLRIPEGHLTTYSRIAETIGNPKAVRAVGTAAGQNHIGYLIPCHRMLRESGELGGYRWGLERKKIMIAMEAGRNEELQPELD
jgi:AraC family transcriptional regulator of adaptative response/methylated-DNA-[protein]-cysteine methyltransferase